MCTIVMGNSYRVKIVIVFVSPRLIWGLCTENSYRVKNCLVPIYKIKYCGINCIKMNYLHDSL